MPKPGDDVRWWMWPFLVPYAVGRLVWHAIRREPASAEKQRQR